MSTFSEGIERELQKRHSMGISGAWVCCVSDLDRNKVAIYRMRNPPDREDIEVVRITFEEGGAYLGEPTIGEEQGSHDLLQAVMQCAWKLGYRPGVVTRTAAARLLWKLQDEGLMLVQGVGATTWRQRTRQPAPLEDPVARLQWALNAFLSDAFTPDPEHIPENGR